jgi:hypothetical protein
MPALEEGAQRLRVGTLSPFASTARSSPVGGALAWPSCVLWMARLGAPLSVSSVSSTRGGAPSSWLTLGTCAAPVPDRARLCQLDAWLEWARSFKPVGSALAATFSERLPLPANHELQLWGAQVLQLHYWMRRAASAI